MEYFEKLERKAEKAKAAAERLKDAKSDKLRTAHDVYLAKAKGLDKHAAKWRALQEENPKKYKSKIKGRKAIRVIAWISISLFILIALSVALAVQAEEDEVKNQARVDTLGIGKAGLIALINMPLPSEKWEEWGDPELLASSTDLLDITYHRKANITIASDRVNNLITAADFGKLKEDIDELISESRAKIFIQSDALSLCGSYFDSIAKFKGSKYHSILGLANAVYNFDEKKVLFYVESTQVNGFGAERKAMTLCTVDLNYRQPKHGYSAYDYILDFATD